jgi:hypothetical protein
MSDDTVKLEMEIHVSLYGKIVEIAMRRGWTKEKAFLAAIGLLFAEDQVRGDGMHLGACWVVDDLDMEIVGY